MIPTGELAPVEGTPFDFRARKKIGLDILRDHPSLKGPSGYDLNYVLKKDRLKILSLAAKVWAPNSRRLLDVYTTEPALQFYTGNHLGEQPEGKEGCQYSRQTGFCLEAQHYPDSPNHPAFPSTFLRKGEVYYQKTIYKFTQEVIE